MVMRLAGVAGVLVGAFGLLSAPVMGQQPPKPAGAPQPTGAAAPTGAAPAAAAPAGDKPDFKKEELEQMLAPIALYPDSLLSQVLMASTYPIEVVEADRWIKANASLKGDALTKELEKKQWDPSVRSLVNFPQVLSMMSDNLATTVKIGDAFIGQEKEVMDTVQRLRAKAQANGNLKSSKEQTVKTETAEGGTQVIVVESSSPEVIYVPQYNPSVVYGGWPYPAYPPYPYYPPGYVASNVVSFGLGVACGAAWGYAFGNCNWGGGDVDIDVNRNTNFNRNIDRSKFQGGDRGGGNRGGQGKWKHDPAHRQGAAYRNQSAANRVGAGNSSNRATQARDQYRGKAEAGRSDLARGGADQFRGNAGARPNQGAGAGNRATSAPVGGKPGGALNSAGRQTGSQARQASDRGYSSRSSSPSRSARPAPSRSSGGGGGGRGGGGRGGGGGRR
jgi:hypothetical protein